VKTRMQPDERRVLLLEAGCTAVMSGGFNGLTRKAAADVAQVAPTNINHHFGNMSRYKGELVKYAVKRERLDVLFLVLVSPGPSYSAIVPAAMQSKARASAYSTD
jgi:hypothetical protein